MYVPDDPKHIPVLLSEVAEAMYPGNGDVVLDCTAGLGGHSAAMAERMLRDSADRRLEPSGTIALVDVDAGNLAVACQRVAAVSAAATGGLAVRTFHGTFAAAPRWLRSMNLRANVVLADLGFCSNQIEDAGRGFSFQRDGPLDMRLHRGPSGQEGSTVDIRSGAPTAGPTAAELVNRLSERELADILREYGEEPAARSIAAKIARERSVRPIDTTGRLAEIVRSAVTPRHGSGIDPATKTFQALRIAVNDELGALQALLDQIETAATALSNGRVEAAWLAGGKGREGSCRIGIITFHSLEDRPVKQCFARLIERGLAEPIGASGRSGKPIVAGEDEVRANPRSRSAKLRAIRLLS